MIILASRSPRRKELLGKIVDEFEIVDSHIDESTSLFLSPLEAVRDIAKRKGEAIKDKYPNDIIISADTIVVFSNQIIGKPKDKNDAKRILKLLSNNAHQVITAYSIRKGRKMILHHVISEVTFNDLSDELIDKYIDTGSPLDKAGAYGIQDNESYPIISSFKGSLTNVIGFPIDEIKKDLMSFGIKIK